MAEISPPPTIPGGLTTQVQYNNAGAFGGTNIYVGTNLFDFRNGTSAQTARVFNTYTDASNYERGVFDWSTTANTLTIGTQQLGTGVSRVLALATGGVTRMSFNAVSFNITMPDSGLSENTLRFINTSGSLYLGIDTNAGGTFGGGNYARVLYATGTYPLNIYANSIKMLVVSNDGSVKATSTGGLGYGTGAGGAVTQITSRTTGVTLNTPCGALTLVSAAGTTAIQAFTVTNSSVAAADTIHICQKSGADRYRIYVTATAAGSFEVSCATLSGTTTEQPVFNFAVIKAVTS